LALAGPAAQLVATSADEVVAVLSAVDQAAAEGWWAAGFVSYEAASGLDEALTTLPSPGGLPLAWFCLFRAAHDVEAVAPARPSVPSASSVPPYAVGPWRADWDEQAYASAVEAVRGRIGAGDTYQCNLTMRLRSEVSGDLPAFYRDLVLAQRGTHNAFVDTGRFVVASASPELFFEWAGGTLTAKPMKGTSVRGRWAEEDLARASALAGSAKDRAENVMIVDLVRNDLGKLAETGSVRVPALFDLERYETLWQLTSTVTARPRAGTTLAEVFGALFPCGSVTGAPKASTMALIAELEEGPRGVYCGAIGVVAPPGAAFRARFNVAIRTVVVDRASGEATYGTGGGVTWGSDPSAEHAEALAKAAVLEAAGEDFSLVETMGYWPGEGLRNRARHLERLGRSAAYFGFRLGPESVASALQAALEVATAPCRVRLVASRDGSVDVELAPVPPPPGRPVPLVVDPEPVSTDQVWLYHKTTRRSAYELRAARHPGADDVVLVNERGEPTETTVANLAVRTGGQWWTPPVASGCLPGAERARLVEEGKLQERPISLAELYAASEVALVSSLRGWRLAVLLPASAAPPGPGR
jgi:para-aminobenzoate synthetase/4-amino-4-deoxychorismate lyase